MIHSYPVFYYNNKSVSLHRTHLQIWEIKKQDQGIEKDIHESGKR